MVNFPDSYLFVCCAMNMVGLSKPYQWLSKTTVEVSESDLAFILVDNS